MDHSGSAKFDQLRAEKRQEAYGKLTGNATDDSPRNESSYWTDADQILGAVKVLCEVNLEIWQRVQPHRYEVDNKHYLVWFEYQTVQIGHISQPGVSAVTKIHTKAEPAISKVVKPFPQVPAVLVDTVPFPRTVSKSDSPTKDHLASFWEFATNAMILPDSLPLFFLKQLKAHLSDVQTYLCELELDLIKAQQPVDFLNNLFGSKLTSDFKVTPSTKQKSDDTCVKCSYSRSEHFRDLDICPGESCSRGSFVSSTPKRKAFILASYPNQEFSWIEGSFSIESTESRMGLEHYLRSNPTFNSPKQKQYK